MKRPIEPSEIVESEDTEHLRPLKERVRDYIEQTDFVSFAELANRFGDHFKGGDYGLEMRPNLVLWAGISQEGFDAINQLLDERAIFSQSCSPLIYLADGMSLRFPIARRDRDYAKPHWAPMTLRPIARLSEAKRTHRAVPGRMP